MVQTRADIQAIKNRLDKGLAALASAVTGNQAYAAKQLDDLKPFVLPLLASPVVGEGSAYDAAYALARCLPGALHEAAFAVASALQMVVQSRQEGMPTCGVFHLVLFGLLYKATLMVASIDLQILQRLRPYPMRGHRLLSTHVVLCESACTD